jgi:hypothetical protein
VVGRTAALLALGAALGFYYAFHESLWDASTWWDVAFLSIFLIPACFVLVWLALPLWRARGLLPTALALAALTWALHVAGRGTPENFGKLAVTTLIGFWFLNYFEAVSWVVLVSLIIPWVDAYSVWRGPTKVIVTHHEQVFTTFSFAFPIPGEGTAANLGLPDLLFFAVFLGAAARFALRPGWTWLALTSSFGATIALAVGFELGGLPALPLLSLGFLGTNVDLLWRRLRAAPDASSLEGQTSRIGPDRSRPRSSEAGSVDGEGRR